MKQRMVPSLNHIFSKVNVSVVTLLFSVGVRDQASDRYIRGGRSALSFYPPLASAKLCDFSTSTSSEAAVAKTVVVLFLRVRLCQHYWVFSETYRVNGNNRLSELQTPPLTLAVLFIYLFIWAFYTGKAQHFRIFWPIVFEDSTTIAVYQLHTVYRGKLSNFTWSIFSFCLFNSFRQNNFCVFLSFFLSSIPGTCVT